MIFFAFGKKYVVLEWKGPAEAGPFFFIAMPKASPILVPTLLRGNHPVLVVSMRFLCRAITPIAE